MNRRDVRRVAKALNIAINNANITREDQLNVLAAVKKLRPSGATHFSPSNIAYYKPAVQYVAGDQSVPVTWYGMCYGDADWMGVMSLADDAYKI